MRQVGQNTDLALEALPEVVASIGQHLDRDLFPALPIGAAVDGRRPTAGDPLEDLEPMLDDLADG
jgi:hypothetical protein